MTRLSEGNRNGLRGSRMLQDEYIRVEIPRGNHGKTYAPGMRMPGYGEIEEVNRGLDGKIESYKVLIHKEAFKVIEERRNGFREVDLGGRK